MANNKIKADDWAIARARWEGEPRCSYTDLTVSLGISKQAIAKRAAKEGWRKMANMAAIADKAHAAADNDMSREAALLSKNPIMVDDLCRQKLVVVPSVATGANTTPEMLAQRVEDAAVAARAQILTRHRSEWPAVRNQIYKALKSQDYQAARLAKSAAETLKLAQDGERKAWDLDAVGDEKAICTVIERTANFRVVQ